MNDRPRLGVSEVAHYERPVGFRLPFRFGAVTVRHAPQAFVRLRVRFADGHQSEGVAAELMVPKWFDKSSALTHDDNFDQLRRSLRLAGDLFLSAPVDTGFGLSAAVEEAHHRRCEAAGLNGLVASYGLALHERAIIDALGRHLGEDVFTMTRANRFGITAATAPDLGGFDLDAFLGQRRPAASIAARHTVGLADALTAGDLAQGQRLDDGLPETLEEVIAAYGHRYFKLKVSGDIGADIERLGRIASVLDQRVGTFQATLDGNEQFESIDAVVELWRRIGEQPGLARLRASILFIEQPIMRARALAEPVSALARDVPLEIDESDADIGTFPRAQALGYRGISAKSCKGFYRALLNCARVAQWNARQSGDRCFMSAEDLTTQPGIAVQQDLALATLVGATHVERNGHHYVAGMAGAPAAEQESFRAAHPRLYRATPGGIRLAITDGELAIASLADVPGLAVGPMPDLASMQPMAEVMS